MKRILCLIGSMNAGGAETFLMKIYRNIDRGAYQFDFCINSKEKCFYEDEIISLGGRIFRIPSKSESLKEFKNKLADLIRREDVQYVLRITSSAMGLMDLRIAKKAGARICAARSSNSSDGDSLFANAAHHVGRILFGKYADVKLAPSDLAAQYTFGRKAYEEGKVHILHNALDLNVFGYCKAARDSIRNEFRLDESTKIIGHVGRFVQQKNHAFLLDVFGEIHKREENTVLLLAGTGPLEADIREKAKRLGLSDSVIFSGVRNDIPRLLSAMDLFLFPSFYEGMPNTVIEAQATGLPCVISDSITREADITGLVTYMPLEASIHEWAETALAGIRAERMDTKQIFIDKKYDIQSVVKEFTQLIFTEKDCK